MIGTKIPFQEVIGLSKFNMRLSYKELQIIKHSLDHYSNRSVKTKKEYEEERRLYNKISNDVNEIKEKNNIE